MWQDSDNSEEGKELVMKPTGFMTNAANRISNVQIVLEAHELELEEDGPKQERTNDQRRKNTPAVLHDTIQNTNGKRSVLPA